MNLRRSRTTMPSISPDVKCTDCCADFDVTFYLRIICSALGHEIRSAQQTFEGPGVGPPAFQLVPGHLISFDVVIVDVRYFQFAAAGGLQSAHDVVNVSVVHINSDDSVVRLGLRWLLFNSQDPRAIKNGHAKTLGIGNFLQEDLGAAALATIRAHCRANVSFNDVVTQYHAN